MIAHYIPFADHHVIDGEPGAQECCAVSLAIQDHFNGRPGVPARSGWVADVCSASEIYLGRPSEPGVYHTHQVREDQRALVQRFIDAFDQEADWQELVMPDGFYLVHDPACWECAASRTEP